MSTLILSPTIVSEGKIYHASVLIGEDGRIDDIISDGSPTPSAAKTIDAHDMLLFPGAIDAHVHFRDPGLTHKADMTSESAAAVSGGVTTVFDMPNTMPQTTTTEAWQEKMRSAQGRMHTNYSFYIGATNNNLGVLMHTDYSQICGIKLFMGSSTGGMLVDNDETLRQLFRNAPTIIAAHCEDESIIRANSELARQQYGDKVPWREHANIRSAEACIKSSAHAVSLAREAGARLHILHITTADELSLLDKGSIGERRITGEACPAHLFFTNQDYDRLGPLIKCNPSVKTQHDRDALRQAVANKQITTIGTDHAPHALTEKNSKSYWHTPSGMPMIEHSLPLMLRLADEGCWNYTDVAACMAENVAELYGMKDRGYIRRGYFADLALVQKTDWTIENVRYKCQWTPLLNEKLHHKIVYTFVNGQIAYDNGNLATANGQAVEFLR